MFKIKRGENGIGEKYNQTGITLKIHTHRQLRCQSDCDYAAVHIAASTL